MAPRCFESPLYRAAPAITTHACHSISDVGHTSPVLSLSGSLLPFFPVYRSLPPSLSLSGTEPFPPPPRRRPRARAVYPDDAMRPTATGSELHTRTAEIEFPPDSHPAMIESSSNFTNRKLLAAARRGFQVFARYQGSRYQFAARREYHPLSSRNAKRYPRVFSNISPGRKYPLAIGLLSTDSRSRKMRKKKVEIGKEERQEEKWKVVSSEWF